MISSATSTLVNTGPLAEAEVALDRVVDRDARDVGRQQVGGELHRGGRHRRSTPHRLRQRRLAGARRILDEQMALGQHAAEGQADGVGLAPQHLLDVVLQPGTPP